MIELLKEQYAAIIDELIIHGLDKSFKYINTGIKWIENIPEHWNIQKVKYIFKEISIKNYGKETQLAATQLYGVVPKDTLDFRTVEVSVSDLNTFKLVQENNFVISLRSFEGGIEYSTYRGIISPAYTVMEALKDIDFKYFKYLFKSNIFIQALNIHKTGIREGQNISFTKFKDDFLPLPPKDEQKQIAEYIEIQTAKIDKAIELQQNYIAKLKEYKASLIDSVVTGKVRVA
jgi:type I restriction enzyme S subunit